ANQQASVKAIEDTCVTCGEPHPYYECLATGGNTFDACAAVGPYNQGECETEATKDNVQDTSSESIAHVQPSVIQVPILEPEVAPKPNLKPSIPYPSRLNEQKLCEKANNQTLKFFQIFQRLHFDIRFADAILHMPKFASTFKSLLSNKEKLFELWKKLSLKELTPTRMTLELANQLVAYPVGVAEDVFVKVGKFYFPADFVAVDYDVDPRVPLILKRPFLRTARALIDVRDVSSEEYAQEVLEFLDSLTSGNPTPSDPIIASFFSSFTPFKGSDFILEELETFLRTPDELSILDDDFDPEGDITLIEKLLNEDPSLNLPLMKNEDLKQANVSMTNPSIEEPPKLELRDLPSHLEYAFLEGTDKLPVIIYKELKDEEKAALLNVLKSHKWAIAWKIFDIKGIDPRFCTYKILIEDDFKPAVQYQRRVNPKIHEVIKKEVIKLFDAGLVYPISDSPWVSPIHCVPKKGRMTIVENEDNELLPTRLVMGWRVCIDYHKLNDDTRKDHFLLPFLDQMLERLAGNEYYCFLDGFLGYCQIPIDLQDQDKTTFTFPYGTFAYRRMPFGLCNAPGTFQMCMMAIFHDMIEETMEVEAKALPTNDARVVVKFLKSLLALFRTPRAIISDRDTHFCNDQFEKVMLKYRVTHHLSTAYHPQTSRQVEVSNRGLKRILERTIGENRASRSNKLDDAL
nr:DNA-directed DNA polymerase [Tanacetum cinerariifolium]